MGWMFAHMIFVLRCFCIDGRYLHVCAFAERHDHDSLYDSHLYGTAWDSGTHDYDHDFDSNDNGCSIV